MQEIKIDKNKNADNITDYLDEQTEKFNIQYAKKMLKNRKMLALFLIGLIVFIVLFSLFIKFISVISAPENGIGNSENSGKVAHDGEYSYIALADGLYREQKNKITKISNDNAKSIIINDGDVYYLNFLSQKYYDIKVIKKDNNEVETIKHINTNIDKIYYYDNSILYNSSEDGFGIRKISLDDMNESIITLANIIDFSVEKNNLYYTDIIGKLTKIDLKTNKEMEVDSTHGIKNFQVKKNWIYFYSNKDSGLCKIKNNGKGFKVVNTSIKSNYFNITDKGNIYYLNQTDKGIYSGKVESNNLKQVVPIKNITSTINVLKGIIYYEDIKEENSSDIEVIRIKPSGRKAKDFVVLEGEVKENSQPSKTASVEETQDTSNTQDTQSVVDSTDTEEIENTNSTENVENDENTTSVQNTNGVSNEIVDDDTKNKVTFEVSNVVSN